MTGCKDQPSYSGCETETSRQKPALELTVLKTSDFEITGAGTSAAWARAPSHAMTRIGSGRAAYATSFKTLYSPTGLYFLFDCEDRQLACTIQQDCGDLWLEDAIEVFLWPDERQGLYLQYDISPLGVELPLLVPNHGGAFFGWRPWHYDGPRRVRRATSVRGGPKAPMAGVEGWSAEFFIPFALLAGLGNCPPWPGARWRANMYRVDHDDRPASHWAWCERTGTNTHAFREYGTLVFSD